MKSLFLFFAFLSIYFILVLLGNFEIDFSSFFGLNQKYVIFGILGIALFITGKDSINEEKKVQKNIFQNILIYSFFAFLGILVLNTIVFYHISLGQSSIFSTFLSVSQFVQYHLFFLMSIFGILIFDKLTKIDSEEKNTLFETFGKKDFIFLFIIFLVFLGSRFGFPFLYTGSYIDEYNHLFSGIDFFQNGHFSIFNNEGEYFRGAFLSIYIGIIFLIFGKSILIAKLSIIFLSTLSFVLIYKISNIIFQKKYFRYLTLILFTINPFILFEHIYIRPYIIYEISLLFIIFMFFKIIQYIKNNNIIKIFLSLLLINGIGFIIYFFSEKDVHRYIIMLISLFLSVYLYLFEFGKLQIKSKILSYLFSRSLKVKIIFLLCLAPIGFYILNIHALIIAIIENKAYHGAVNVSKYYSLFFGEYFIFSILSIFAGGFIVNNFIKTKKISANDIILFLGIGLLIAHLLSNTNTHLIRGIIYILPLYFLISVYGLSIIQKNNKYFSTEILIVFILLSYPAQFLKSPYLPEEINYMEYQKISNFLQENCNNKTIIGLIHNVYVFDFHDVKIDYTANLYVEEKDQKAKYNQVNGKFFTIYKNIPVITSMKELKEISASNSCIILNDESKHYWYYFDNNEIDFLNDNFQKKTFGTQTPINIFYN